MALVTALIGIPGTAHAAGRARVEPRPCPVAVPQNTGCGFLIVPELRGMPGTNTIKVGYAVHRSAGPNRRPDPVVFSSGGPGSASLQLTTFLSEMVPDRDVVVIEQRGGRHSEPVLSCPEIVRGLVETLTTPGQTSDETATITKEALACRNHLQADLRGYDTDEIAADVVDLRRALGYPRWNLFGVGYSTRSMLQAASQDPGGTRSVVLDSFLPAETNRYDTAAPGLRSAIDKLGMSSRFDQMVARLNARPVAYATRDPLTRKRITVKLTGDDAAAVIGEALRGTETIPIVPAVIEGLADGRADLLQPLVDAAGDNLASKEWGLYYAVQCQDEVPFNTFTDQGHPRLPTGVTDTAVCASWGLPTGSSEGAITSAPVLVVGGQYDPATPPEAAREAAQILPGARFAEFAGIGQEVFLASECGRRTIAAFLDDPRAAAPCDPAKAAAPIVRPGDLHLTSAGYRATGSPLLLIPPMLFVIAAAVQLLTGLVAVARRRGGGLHALAGLAGLVFTALAALSLYGMADQSTPAAGAPLALAGAPPALAAGPPPALVVGVPSVLAWYGILAVISTGLATTAAFRLRATAIQIVPALVGLVFLTWLYGWLLA